MGRYLPPFQCICVLPMFAMVLLQPIQFIRHLEKVTILALPEVIRVHGLVKTLHAEMLGLLPHVSTDQGGACELMSQKLETLASFCTAADQTAGGQGYPAKVVRIHQDILRNEGVYAIVEQILQKPLRCRKVPGALDEPEDGKRCQLFMACLLFICAFTRNNARNQEASFQRMDLFLSFIGVALLGRKAADAITSTLHNNWTLLFQVGPGFRIRCTPINEL